MLNGCTTVKWLDLFLTCYLSLIGQSFFLFPTRLNWQTIYNRPVKGRRQDSISKENSLFTDNANCLAFFVIFSVKGTLHFKVNYLTQCKFSIQAIKYGLVRIMQYTVIF